MSHTGCSSATEISGLDSYAKVYAWGSSATSEFVADPGDVVVQEKIDGSQFSFGSVDGVLRMRSKNDVIYTEGKINDQFAPAVASAVRCHSQGLLPEGWTFRAEAMKAPKHNTVCYGRVPAGNMVLFDVDRGTEDYVGGAELGDWAAKLGVEAVPVLYEGAPLANEKLRALLETDSVLGRAKVEGVVVKPVRVAHHDRNGKRVAAKLVRSDFVELNQKTWKKQGKQGGDVVARVCARLPTEPRWRKAVQRLADSGVLTGSPRDIGLLVRSVIEDVHVEEADNIGRALYEHYRPGFAKAASGGHVRIFVDGVEVEEAEYVGRALYEHNRKAFAKAAYDGLAVWYKRHLAGMTDDG